MKPLPPGSYLVRPFKAYKSHQYNYTYLGAGNPQFIAADEALPLPPNWSFSGSGIEPVNTNGIFKHTLYKSLLQVFYPSMSLSGGIHQSGSFIRPPMFNRIWGPTANPAGSYVIGISQAVFGEQVRPGSFKVTTTSGTASLVDNGSGSLYSDSNPSKIIGNIFYPLGIAVVGKTTGSLSGSVISDQGIYLTTGSILTVHYQSQLTLYEHIAVCTLNRNEFNFTSNPSLSLFRSSSVSGSVSLLDFFSSGTLTPYITTIGLYDQKNNLVAIGKLPRPLKRAVEVDQTFVIKIDVL